jgi:hypothetical protein
MVPKCLRNQSALNIMNEILISYCVSQIFVFFHFEEMGKHCHVYEWLSTGFGLVNGFTDHLQVVTTNNYNTTAELHTLQIIAR